MPNDAPAAPAAAWPDCDHFFVSMLKGGEPLSVRLCTQCHEPDWDDLRRQLDERDQAAPFDWRITKTQDSKVGIVVGDTWPQNDGSDGPKLTEESYEAVTYHLIGKALRKVADSLIDASAAAAYREDDDGWDD